MFDVDIDELRDQLGTGNIQRTLKNLNDTLASLDSLPAVPQSEKDAIQPLNRFISTHANREFNRY